MRKLIIIFMLLGVTLNAQLYQIPQRISKLSDVTVPSATHTQSGSDYLDSLLLTHADGEGFLPIKVDSLTGTSNITFPADVEQLADSNRFLVPNLVTNSGFSSDVSWTKGAGWTIGSGTAIGTGASATNLSQSSVLEVGKSYRISFDLVVTSGTVEFTSSAPNVTHTVSGHFVYDFICDNTSLIFYAYSGANAFTGTIDNVIITKTNNWIETGDAQLTLNADSSATYYGNASSDIGLPINLTEDQGYELTVDLVEGEEQLVTDPSFDNASEWSGGAAWSWVGGTFSVDGSQSSTIFLNSDTELPSSIEGEYVELEYKISSYSVGNIQVYLDGSNKGSLIATADGVYNERFLLSGTSGTILLQLRANSTFVGSIEYLTIYKVDESQSVESSILAATYGNQVIFTSDTITSTTQSISQRFISQYTNDTLKFVLSDSAKVKISNLSLKSLNDYRRINYGDSIYAWYYKDISTLGTFNEKVYAHYNGKTDSADVGYSVVPEVALAYNPSNDTLDFGTVSGYTVGEIKLINNSYTPISSRGLSGLSPFAVVQTPTPVPASDSVTWSFSYNPLEDTTLIQNVNFLFTDATNGDWYKTITFKIIVSGVSSEILGTPVLAIDDTIGSMDLSWAYIPNADGYYIYRNGTKIATTASNAYSDIINPFYEESYYVVAYNDLETAQSNTVSRTMLPNGAQGTDYYLISNTQSGVNFTTIAGVNSSGQSNKEYYFYYDDVFTDAVLTTNNAYQTYGSYGARTNATLGDSTITGYTNAISITKENITIKNLNIVAYYNTSIAIAISEDAFRIEGCNIIGAERQHDTWGHGIETTATTLTKQSYITRNNIRDFARGIYLRRPYNMDVGYNTISYMYVYTGYQDVGGGCIVLANGGSDLEDAFNSAYTVNIHHNDLTKYEHTAAFVGSISRIIMEYNHIHDNLDCRLYLGGVKHGGVGKFWDETGQTVGSIGSIFRYNLVENTQREGLPGYTYQRPSKANIKAGIIDVVDSLGSNELPIFLNVKNTPNNLYSEPYEGYADGGISGLGWANHYIHNNVFYNMGHKVYSVGYNREIFYFYTTATPKPSAGAVYTTSGTNYTVLSSSSTYIVVKKSGGDIEYPSNTGTLTYISGTGSSSYTYTRLRIAGDVIGYTRKFRTDFPKYFVNNTSFKVGKYNTTTGYKGVLGLEFDSQSPTHIYNNIFDIRSDENRVGMYINEDQTYISGNMFPTRSGEVYTSGSDFSEPSANGYAIWYRSLYENDNVGGVINNATNPINYMNTKPEFNDTTSTIFVSNVGPDGVYMYDFSLLESSNAYNVGVDYADINGGYDGEGRSFAYDILGNLRTVNTIGAFGLKVEDTTPSVPEVTITQQPTDVIIYDGGDASFSVIATTNNTGALGYKWWRHPYVDTTSLVVDTGKYSGATTNILTITGVSSTEASDSYLCEVYNQSNVSVFENSNPVSITLLDGTLVPDSSITYPATSRDDAYYYGSASYNTNANYVYSGKITNSMDVFLRFRSITIPSNAIIDSAKIIFISYNNQWTSSVNIRISAEKTNIPAIFSTGADAYTREANLTTAYEDYTLASWTTGTAYEYDVKTVVDELYASYSWGSNDMAFFIQDNGSTAGTVYRAFKSFDGGTDLPVLKIWYRN